MRVPRLQLTLLLLLVIAALPRVAHAQQPDATSPRAIAAPLPDLKLTAAQQGALRAITLDTRAKQRAIVARQTPGRGLSAADHAALVQLATQHNAAVRAALTPDQVQLLESRRQAVEAAQRARGRRPQGGR